MNDRYFDLGNLSVNNGFEAEDDRALLELYFDEPVHRARASPRCSSCAHRPDFREAMWGVVQRGRSDARLRLRRLRRPSTSTGSSAPRPTRAWRSGWRVAATA